MSVHVIETIQIIQLFVTFDQVLDPPMFLQRDINYMQLSLLVHSLVSQDCFYTNSSFSVFFLVWEPHVGECIFKHWNHERFVKLEFSQHIGSSSGSSHLQWFLTLFQPWQLLCQCDYSNSVHQTKVLMLLHNFKLLTSKQV